MWRALWESYGGRVTGVLAGMLCGLIYLISGFWDMLFCALLVGVGYGLGKRRDAGSGPLLPWDRLSEWLSDRWPRSR